MIEDFEVFIFAIAGFLIFVTLHLVIFRYIDKRKVFVWLIRIFFLGMILTIAAFNLSFRIPFSVVKFESLLLISVMYSLASLAYTLALFGITATSLRIRILFFISEHPQGVSERHILRKYDSSQIVKSRLARFAASGEIVKIKGKYRLAKNFPLFLLPALFFRFIFILYGRKPSY